MPIFMNIEGIEGESTDKDFQKWIEISSFSWGEGNSPEHGTGGGGGAGKAHASDITVQKVSAKGSTQIFLYCAEGKHIATIKIALARTAGTSNEYTYLLFTLTDCLISAYQISDDGERPSESISINFEKLKYDLADSVSVDGSVRYETATWDFFRNIGG